MELLDVDEVQATAILDMQLRRLAALERQRILDELAEIEARIADLQAILDSPERQRQIIRDELTEIVEKATYNSPALNKLRELPAQIAHIARGFAKLLQQALNLLPRPVVCRQFRQHREQLKLSFDPAG